MIHSCLAMPIFIYLSTRSGLTGLHMYTFSVFTLNTICISERC